MSTRFGTVFRADSHEDAANAFAFGETPVGMGIPEPMLLKQGVPIELGRWQMILKSRMMQIFRNTARKQLVLSCRPWHHGPGAVCKSTHLAIVSSRLSVYIPDFLVQLSRPTEMCVCRAPTHVLPASARLRPCFYLSIYLRSTFLGVSFYFSIFIFQFHLGEA